MFKGSLTALVTPFAKDGSLDEQAFRDLVNWQIEEGTNGLVPVGTTGESPTLTHDEHKRVVEICVEASAKRAPVIAGAGSNNTANGTSTLSGFVNGSNENGVTATPVVKRLGL